MTLSTFTVALLSAKIPSDLALAFGFPTYASLAALVYPIPKYSTFKLKKKNGSEREIHVPESRLKSVQRQLLVAFNELDDSRPSVHGFIKGKGRSVVSNARAHSGLQKKYVFNIDLKDFFPSITFARIRGVFLSAPFSLPPRVATVLARICSNNGILPQGAPTSPSISNYICRGLDGRLQFLAKSHLATYSRYADDITFSFTQKYRDKLPGEIVDTSLAMASVGPSLQAAIDENGFIINPAKVRLSSRHRRMEVTGLTVNEFPNVQRRYVDEIRGMLHSWERHGLKLARNSFASRLYKRQLRSEAVPPFENFLRGKLLYLKMVKGQLDKVYNSLARRFNNCILSTLGCTTKKLFVSDIVSNELDLEKATFIICCRNELYNFELKGTCFFLENIGIVTCDHVLVYPKNNVGGLIHTFPAALSGNYFGFSEGEIFLQDQLETDLCRLEIVWSNQQADVAVLRCEKTKEVPHFNLQGNISETKTKDILLVGYPFHNPGKSLSIAEGKIRSRYRNYTLHHYDITPLIRQGNSGGPVLDRDFRVIGVAKDGELQNGGNNGVLKLEEVYRLNDHYCTLHGPPSLGKPCVVKY